MKAKLFFCLAVSVFLIQFSIPVQAEVKFSGNFDFFAGYNEYNNFIEDGSGSFEAVRELKLNSVFTGGENIKAVMSLQIGEAYSREDGGYFGTPSAPMGGEADADSALEVDALYLDFNWPGTNVNFRIGNQFVALPDKATQGSNICYELPAAVVMNSPLPFRGDSLSTSLTLGWSRFHTDVQDVSDDKEDLMWGAVPIETKNFTITPYFAYATIGEDIFNGDADRSHWDYAYFDWYGFFEEITGRPIAAADDSTEAYYGGVNLSLSMFDPLNIAASVNWGQMEFKTVDGQDPSAEGWLADLVVNYKMDFVTPELIFSWSEGPDENDEDADMFPPLIPGTAIDTNFFDGSLINDADTFIGHQTLHNVGMWIAGLKFKDIHLMDRLTNEIQFLYIEGTADKDIFENPNRLNHYSTMLNEDSSAIVINLNTGYKLYDNLDILSEVGYIVFDEDNDYDERVNPKIEDQFKAFAGLRYKF